MSMAMLETRIKSKLIETLDVKLDDSLNAAFDLPFMPTRIEQRMMAALATIRGKPGWEALVDDAMAREAWTAEINEKHAVKDIEIEYILAELKYNAKLNAAGQKHGTNFTTVDMVWTAEVSDDDELAHDVKNNVAAVLENQPLEDRDWIAPTDNLDFMIPTNADDNSKPSQHTSMQLSLIDPSLYAIVAGDTEVIDTPITIPFDENKHIYMGLGPGMTKDMQKELKYYESYESDDIKFIGEYNDLRNILTKLSLKYKAADSGEALVKGVQRDSSKHSFATDMYVDMDYYINSISQERNCNFGCRGPYAWIPSDILVAADGSVEIMSYINNLHPVEHASMYRVIERVISRCLPVLSQVLTDLAHRPYFRVPATVDDCIEETVKLSSYNRWDIISNEEYNLWKDGIIFTEPKPSQFTEPERPLEPYTLSGEQLQVFVKMDNTYVFPESPEHNESYFTAEGACGEYIIATAVYYYDIENIANLHMKFKECIDCVGVENFSYLSDLDEILYGVDVGFDYASLDVQLGNVPVNNGTIICYPNTYERRLSEIKLADPARRGHVKMLTFYFADPRHKLISTARVPPQQRRWQQLPKQVNAIFNNRLPEVIVNRIAGYVNRSWSLGMAAFVRKYVELQIRVHNDLENDRTCFGASFLNNIS